MQKALECIQSVPKRAYEIQYIKNIQNYPGDTSRLGRIYRHVRLNFLTYKTLNFIL